MPFHLQARRVTVRLDYHTYSLLISNVYPLFHELLYAYQTTYLISDPVISGYSLVLSFYSEKAYIFLSKCCLRIEGVARQNDCHF